MHVVDETIPVISSNLGCFSSLVDLHSVGLPWSIEDHSVFGNELIELQSHIARDDLCKKTKKLTHCITGNSKKNKRKNCYRRFM
jgi:hypothetical protein